MVKAGVRSHGAKGQAIVEFGLVALLFTLLLFGIVDLGILLNGWLGVSSSTRDLARQAAVGLCPAAATTPPAAGACGNTPPLPPATSLVIQGLDRRAPSPVSVQLQVCDPGDPTHCYTANDLSNIYPGGSCDPTAATCTHPKSNDSIVLTLTAQIQVVTPLVRPFFGCTNNNVRCDVPIKSRAVTRFEGPFI